MAPGCFQMSKKDGKSVLLKSVEKRGFHTLKMQAHMEEENLTNAAAACPVKIISVKII